MSWSSKSYQSFTHHSLLIAHYFVPLLLCLIYVWQGLFGSRPRRRMIEQYRHFLQLIEFRTGPDQNLMRLCGVARAYLHYLTYGERRRINAVLASRQYEIANLNILEPGHITHFHQALLPKAPD